VSGLLARVRVRQAFHNPGSAWAEAVYVFPLPEQAAVDRLRMRIGERIIEGEIQERESARQQYAQARQEGRRAALVEQERPNVFTTAVANIAPGARVEVEIEYQQTLRQVDGEFRLRFPMVVGPRYIPGQVLAAQDAIPAFGGDGWALATDAVPDAPRITPPVRAPGAGAINPVRLSIELDAGFPIAELESAHHAIRRQLHGPGRMSIQLDAGEVPADRDFELAWRPASGTEPRAAWFHQALQDRHYGMLMLMPPLEEARAAPRPVRDLIFVIDTSGSMHGDSIHQARQALQLALDRLGPGDRFNIIHFNQHSQALFGEPQSASVARVRQARAHVQRLQAQGGTEMLPALQLALGQGGERGALRQVVFLTDGAVGNEEALFQAIRDGLGDSRLFTVGIGSAPNSHFMRKAAGYGRGTFTHIGDSRQVATRMQALLRKLEQPALTDIRLEVEGEEPLELHPARIPDLYRGEPLLLVFRSTRLPGEIRLSGRLGTQAWQTRLSLAGGHEGAGIATEWARRRIDDLADRAREARDPEHRAALRRQALETALGHRLVSADTSLVAVDRTPARSRDQALRRHALETNLPHGWSHAHVFGSPQTATAASRQGIAGLALLAMAGLLGGWQHRRGRTNGAPR
jgi:Ca-activated chloride channel family protein